MNRTAARKANYVATVADVAVTASFRHLGYDLSWGEFRKNRDKTTRVYGALDALAAAEMAQEPFVGEFLFTAKEQPTRYARLDDVDRAKMDRKVAEWRKWRNATVKAARERLAPLLVRFIAENDFNYVPKKATDTKVRMHFSIYAGCSSCPCSPGLVLEGQLKDAEGTPVDLWVEPILAQVEEGAVV